MGLHIIRDRGETEKTEALAAQITTLNAPCVGCSDCRGICQALLEAMTVPDIILGSTRS